MQKLFTFLSVFFQMLFCSAQQFAVQSDSSKIISLKVDSAVQLNDLKKGFKDLFIPKKEEAEINVSQLNPRAISFVEDYIQRHKTNLEKLKGWGRPYFDMIDAVLTFHGLPKELKYLAVIESHLKTYAVSWAGAVGPWQFMPATARRMGLRVDNYYDERTDYYKSTHAAARYLTELYSVFNDWLLVIAAYNGGPGNVNSAIRRSSSTDFWTLQYHLPAESRDHVKKFIATHYIMEGEGGLTTLTKEETKDFVEASLINPAAKYLTADEFKNSKITTLSGKYNSLIISKHILLPIADFNRYNPEFDKLIANNGSYELRLSPDKMDVFIAKRYEILNESIQVLLDSFRQSLSLPVKKGF
jgi:membrane-bound lytic murein transglycosylase D